MNIDGELESLLESIMLQEGFFKKKKRPQQRSIEKIQTPPENKKLVEQAKKQYNQFNKECLNKLKHISKSYDIEMGPLRSMLENLSDDVYMGMLLIKPKSKEIINDAINNPGNYPTGNEITKTIADLYEKCKGNLPYFIFDRTAFTYTCGSGGDTPLFYYECYIIIAPVEGISQYVVQTIENNKRQKGLL